jgi:hypothetical protein
MSVNLDRRAFISAAAATSIVTTAPAAALATVDRMAWRAAMDAHELAIAEDAAFDPLYWEDHRAWEAGKPSMDTIHWHEFRFVDLAHTARAVNLEEQWQHFLSGEGTWWNARDPEDRKARFRVALDSVQASRDAEARHARESGMDEAEKRWEELGAEVARTRDVLMALPAPDLSAHRWKLVQLRDGDGDLVGWSADFVHQTFVDVDRLVSAGEA